MECIICLDKSEYITEFSCGHTLCLECGCRLIYLYKEEKCPFCNANNISVTFKSENKSEIESIFTDKKPLSYKFRTNLNVSFEANAIKKLNYYLGFICKICNITLNDYQALNLHYKNIHNLLLCEVCYAGKKEFACEFTTYTLNELYNHKKFGDISKPHVFCPFCKIYLYNDDAANRHCQQSHEVCMLCDELGKKFVYFRNYKELENHYKELHYFCHYTECLNTRSKFFAYKSELLMHLSNLHNHLNLVDIPEKKVGSVRSFNPFMQKDKKFKFYKSNYDPSKTMNNNKNTTINTASRINVHKGDRSVNKIIQKKVSKKITDSIHKLSLKSNKDIQNNNRPPETLEPKTKRNNIFKYNKYINNNKDIVIEDLSMISNHKEFVIPEPTETKNFDNFQNIEDEKGNIFTMKRIVERYTSSIDVLKNIESFEEKKISATTLIDLTESLLGKEKTYDMFNKIKGYTNKKVKNELVEYLIVYKKNMDFPPFVKEKAIERKVIRKKEEIKTTFKIINLRKR
ncbi:hypothetical protein SLOPH_2336 [Spraguea lophii 42_110]|uniref:RING-type domain-containing protein n=1 Tax=Spraguea lophii (strain 42_110) TaxID=1358809 RepID=S7WA47_SPRLO|nr:hypothetical protein SLOPH_2336 [Spraguea lophii 42_110]